MHQESLSCLALHRHRKITSLDCAKVLTNYFRPLETAAGIISLSLSLPGGLRGTTVSMTAPLKERQLVPWFVILSPFRLKLLRIHFQQFTLSHPSILAKSFALWITHRHWTHLLDQTMHEILLCVLSQQCVCMLWAVLLPTSLPLCNRR